MTQLSVNLNKIALIRNSRGIGEPNVVDFARKALTAGAYGITIHPRPDQRHATYQDAYDLKALIDNEFPDRELNIEGYPEDKWMQTVLEVKPAQATLVPDAPNQLTSDHGWNLLVPQASLHNQLMQLSNAGIRTSLFLDPVIEQVEAAKSIETDRIELYTEPYARACESGNSKESLMQYSNAAHHAFQIGLGVNAGHDLNLDNLAEFCKATQIQEVSIGHALTCEALVYGYTATIEKYIALLAQLKE